MHHMRSALALVLLLVGTALPAGAQAPVIEYYHVDALGSVRAVTDATGAVIRTHHYHPFGEGVGVESGADPLRFTGKPRDAETGLDYFGARYYGSRTGRLTTVDPLMGTQTALFDPQRWNRYSYVGNRPTRLIDPDGRGWISAIFKFIVKGGDVASTVAGAVQDTQTIASIDGRVGTGERLLATGSLLTEFLPISGRDVKGIKAAVESGFPSFRAFKRVFGRAGDEMDWHHIVQQHSSNLDRFGPEQIHNIANMMKLDRSVHRDISALYSTKFDFTDRMTFRDWLKDKSFKEQQYWGAWALSQVVNK
jgi:RHS repeat-associated protein